MQKETKAESAVSTMLKNGKLFKTETGEGIIILKVKDNYTPLKITSKETRMIIREMYRSNFKKSLSTSQVTEVVEELNSKAYSDGEEAIVFSRVGKTDSGSILIDPCRPDFSVIEVKPGKATVHDSMTAMTALSYDSKKIIFLRTVGSRTMISPLKGKGTLQDLKRFIGNPDEETFIMIIAWIINSFFVDGPFPLLIIISMAGVGKSTITSLLKRLLDPHIVDRLSPPKDARDVHTALKACWIIPFDNVSSVPQWFSDVLCRTSTGGGTLERELYTNGEAYIFEGKRSVIVNGISDFLHNGDILDRAILYRPNPPEKIIPEHELRERFREVEQGILFDILKLLSEVLKVLPTIKINDPFRMADYCSIGTAIEQVLDYPSGFFMESYKQNRKGGHITAVESSPVATIILKYLSSLKSKKFNGTATILLENLENFDPKTTQNKYFPNTPSSLGSAIRRVTPNLKNIGVNIEFPRTGSQRNIFMNIPENGVTAVQPSLIDDENNPFPEEGR